MHLQGSSEDVQAALAAAPPGRRHVAALAEGRAAVVLRADAGGADVAAACAHGLLLQRRSLVRVCAAPRLALCQP